MLSTERTHFQFDQFGYYIVYVDGSCENNGRFNNRAGYGIYFGPNNPLNRSLPVSGRATSNAAMIQAATQAITLAYRHEIQRLCIRTDSEFLLNAVRFWMSDWKQNKWRKADGYLLENKEDFQLLDETMDRYWGSLKWEKVSAHSGKHGHEAADRLAREGAAKYDEQSPKYL